MGENYVFQISIDPPRSNINEQLFKVIKNFPTDLDTKGKNKICEKGIDNVGGIEEDSNTQKIQNVWVDEITMNPVDEITMNPIIELE